MKRSRYYISVCIIGLLASLLGLILANSDVSFKDLVSFNFTLISKELKKLQLTFFLRCLYLVLRYLFSIGFRKSNSKISRR